MPQAPAFSRLQLAAALLEYDNDPSNPGAPSRRAQDSAIFAHLRRNPAAPPQSSRRSDYLGVSIPSETGSLGGRESALENRRSRASRGSLDALRNPFGQDDNWSDEDEANEEELEVDLASWGLDALIPKDKGKSVKGKEKAAAFTPHPVSSVRSHIPLTNNGSTATAPRRAINTSRSVSLGGIAEHPGLDSKILEAASKRRRSFGSPLDLVDMEIPQFPLQRPRGSSYSAPRPLTSPIHSVPFPSSSARSPSPLDDEVVDRRVSAGSQLIDRGLSRASMDSKLILQDERTGRTSSEMVEPTSDNPFAVRPPSPSRLSRFDPKANSHAGTTSIARGSKLLPDQEIIDSQSQPRRERKYSTTLELLRPKVLVMPSPLQQVTQEAPPTQNQVRDGFLLSTDGPPLPPGARSARHNSMMSVLDSASKPLVASNSFTPNPLMNLSLSQMTFRNTLHIGGVRDPYSEVVGGIPTASQDGEQVHFDELDVNDEDHALSLGGSGIAGLEDNRPAGKLFGKSLIDDLETRKAQMHSKQRVFAGEQTRSGPFIDLATLNNRPTTTGQNSFGIPDSKRVISRGTSSNAKPLLNFDDEGAKFKSLKPTTRMISSRSVFGVDTLWEREVAKLREIEAQEEKAAEEEKRQIEQETRRKKKGKKKKKREQDQDQDQDQDQMNGNFHVESTRTDEHRVPIEPPQLPDIQRATRPPPKVVEDESDDDDPSDDNLEPVVNTAADNVDKWLSDSEEEGPRRTTGIGLRYPNKLRQTSKAEDVDSEEDMPLSATVNRAVQRQRVTRMQKGDESDEEKPLSYLLHKTQSAAPAIPSVNFDNHASGEDDDDDKPLALRASTIANYARQDDDDKPLGLRASSIANYSHRDDDDDKPLGLRASSIANYSRRNDDDDKPLGLRASSIANYSRPNDDDDRPLGLSVADRLNDDDDRPLALHPQQQRRTQYQMMAQQQQQQQQMMVQQQQQMMAQQQQQQMMMQAQLHNSMFFNPSGMLGSGFFGPPVVSPMLMQPPVPAPSPPPAHDAGKFGRVDKWRHDVAVEGTR